MQPFRTHTGKVAPLDRANVDTDQIIPKQFLKRIERTGYGRFLFHDWRYTSDGEPNPSFVLNQSRYLDATVLVAGRNFGCGSSREHAPWALCDYGFRAILAPSFADIFASNGAKNGLLLVALEEAIVADLVERARTIPSYSLAVDLETETIRDAYGFACAFEIDPFRRRSLLEGLDDIGLTLANEAEISAYEARRPEWKEIQDRR